MSLSDKYVEALGMLTTLAPHLEIDSQDPIGMAKVIEKEFIRLRESEEAAWGIIANAHGGDWNSASKAWH